MRNKTTAALLAFFLGGLGGHKFYLGQSGMGFLYLLFFWTFIPAIIAFIEFFVLLSMSEADFNRKYNAEFATAAPSPQNIVVNVANTAHAGGQDVGAKLKTLNELRISGALTEEEFQAQKQRVLSASH